jgi:rare lipoprotein A
MHERSGHRRLPLLLLAAAGSAALGIATPRFAHAAESPKAEGGVQREVPVVKPTLDRSGRKRVGTASVYARMFAGRKMADGSRMDPRDDNAASKTLPLGTEAKVTNLKTGQSATVTIQDRGPYVKGRIVDLSPATAEQIGITPKQGVTKVEVAPIALPRRDDAKN